MTTRSAFLWSLATGTTCYDLTILNGDNMKTVTTTCLEQQPLQEKEKLDPQQHKMFRTTVGQLIWASPDRPDLMYCAKLHSSRLQGPTERDLRSLKHILRYVKGTSHYKLFIGRGLADYLPTTHSGFVTFPQNNIPLDPRCYTDSDWAGDKTTRRSTSGWLCSLLGTPLSYASRTQQTVTLSSAEAELMAWLKHYMYNNWLRNYRQACVLQPSATATATRSA